MRTAVRRLALSIAVTAGIVLPFAASAETGTFLHVSDIHFNPFDPPIRAKGLATVAIEDWPAFFAADPDQTLALYGEDTNHALMTTAMAAIGAAGASADFAFVTGDILGHRFPDNTESVLGYAPHTAASDAFAIRTALFVAASLRTALPGKPVFLSLGNNDSSCGDYQIDPGGTFLAGTRETVRSLAGAHLLADDFDETYLAGGYYAARHPTVPGITVLVLDDVLWSSRYENACGTTGVAAARTMMTWLEGKLAAAKAAGERVWLTHHIPVGLDPYSTIHAKADICKGRIVTMLAEPFASEYVALLAEYGGTITASFTGHTHYDDYRLLRDASGKVTGTEKIAPAISPIFGQNPGFLVFSYDRASGALADFTAHYLGNLKTALDPQQAKWMDEYSFTQAYGQPDFSPATAEAMWMQLSQEGTADDTFRRLYNVSAGELESDGLDAYTCAVGHADAAGYTACYCGG